MYFPIQTRLAGDSVVGEAAEVDGASGELLSLGVGGHFDLEQAGNVLREGEVFEGCLFVLKHATFGAEGIGGGV